MKDLKTKSTLDQAEESTQDSAELDSLGHEEEGGPRLGLDQDQNHGMVRRAGWVSIKPLISLNKDQKLDLVSRRKWKKYWVTLRGKTRTKLGLNQYQTRTNPVLFPCLVPGCSLLFFKPHSLDSEQALDRDQSPRMVLQTWESLVQPVPEHPSRDHVFCLSTGLGQVYLLQVRQG